LVEQALPRGTIEMQVACAGSAFVFGHLSSGPEQPMVWA